MERQANNTVKDTGGGLALQATRKVRRAGLVDDDGDVEAEDAYRADVYVYGFDDLLMVIDADRVSKSDRADLVSTAAGDTGSIYDGRRTNIERAGNGYRVPLPGCEAAGFEQKDKPKRVPTHSKGVLFIHDDSTRLVEDLIAIRQEQVSG